MDIQGLQFAAIGLQSQVLASDDRGPLEVAIAPGITWHREVKIQILTRCFYCLFKLKDHFNYPWKLFGQMSTMSLWIMCKCTSYLFLTQFFHIFQDSFNNQVVEPYRGKFVIDEHAIADAISLLSLLLEWMIFNWNIILYSRNLLSIQNLILFSFRLRKGSTSTIWKGYIWK